MNGIWQAKTTKNIDLRTYDYHGHLGLELWSHYVDKLSRIVDYIPVPLTNIYTLIIDNTI